MPRCCLVFAVVVAACSREYPYPITKKHVAELEDIAERAAQSCDDLLKREECFEEVGASNDPALPSVAIPDAPLEGDPLLRYLGITCDSSTDEYRSCDAKSFRRWREFRIQVPIDCEWKTLWTIGKFDEKGHGNGTRLRHATRPECAGPWGTVQVGRLTPEGNFLSLGAAFAAPEALAPGGAVHYLWSIEDKRDHDAKLLCGDEGWERCLAPDVDPQNCLGLGLQAEGGADLMKALAAQPDPPVRSELAQKYLGRIYYQTSCYLPRQLREDPREHWRLKAEAANRRGPPRVIFDVRSDGPLSEKQVQETLAPALPTVIKCFDEARERLHNLRVGYLAASMKVTPAGVVAAVDGGAMNNPKKDDRLFPCVSSVFRTRRFPRRPRPSVVYVVTTDMPK